MKRILLLFLLLLTALPCAAADDVNLGTPIDSALGEVPYNYARINTA